VKAVSPWLGLQTIHLAMSWLRVGPSEVTWRPLENERGDIATRTAPFGTLPNPEVSTWEALIGLLRNAFVEATAPEFERAVGGG
jgi:hypothetical protein